jgi:hypothetical protein
LITKHPSIRIILYNYFSDSGQTGKTIPGHPDFLPRKTRNFKPRISHPTLPSINFTDLHPSKKCRTEESHGAISRRKPK